jgi:hypothetical protein
VDKGRISARAGWSAVIAWLATVVAPPAVAGGIWRQFVSGHVLLALVIGVAYEVTVATVGFFAVVARGVSSRWQQRLVESLDLALLRKLSGFGKRYSEFLLVGLRFVDLKGLATIGPFTPELDEVFVDVSLISRSPHLIRSGVLSEPTGPGRRALSEFIGRRQAAVIAVVGAPGSGKTTLLRHTARQACIRSRSLHKTARHIPILLYLRDHSAEIVSNSSVSLTTLVRNSLGALAQAEPQGWFDRKLRNGRCLILLDGFDEVARQADRAKVAEWVASQVQYYPENDFVISSRPQGYQTAPVAGAEVVQVCGFTAIQTEKFIRGWYQAIERHSTGAEGAEIEARARSEADDLLRRLEQAPALYDLTVNPLLLTMIANVHRYRGALPGNRAELYSEICQVMLWRRQDAKNLASQISGDKKESVLRTLAYTMMEERVSDLSRGSLLAVINPVLRRQSRRVTADDFLADVVTSGLLIERETAQFAFAHHTFQEYLAAVHIRDNGLVDVLAGAVGDPWWRETTLLYAARSDADSIIAACLSANNLTALALAFECVDQDSAFDPALHAPLDDLLRSAYDFSEDPARRQLMTGVLLTRHLREHVRTPNGHRLCVKPITVEIYNLFLKDTDTPGPDTNSAHQLSGEAIVGVRGSDALAFTDWANSITGGTSTYRLPIAASLDYNMDRTNNVRPGTASSALCIWADNSSQGSPRKPSLWIPNGMRNPQCIDTVFLPVVKADLSAIIPPMAVSLVGLALILTRRVIDNINSVAGDALVDAALAEVRSASNERILAEASDLVTGLIHELEGAAPTSYEFASILSVDIGLALFLTLEQRVSQALKSVGDLRRRPPPGVRTSDTRTLQNLLRQAQPLVEAFAPPFSRSLFSFRDAIGSRYSVPGSMAASIGSASENAIDVNDFLHQFSLALVSNARLDRSNRKINVDPDGLTANLAKAADSLSDELSSYPARENEVPAPWIEITADSLIKEAGNVFSRKAAPAALTSASIRLSALMLAGEMHFMAREDYLEKIGTLSRLAFLEANEKESKTAPMLLDVVAGITWLERRHRGTEPAIETIMLAVE